MDTTDPSVSRMWRWLHLWGDPETLTPDQELVASEVWLWTRGLDDRRLNGLVAAAFNAWNAGGTGSWEAQQVAERAKALKALHA